MVLAKMGVFAKIGGFLDPVGIYWTQWWFLDPVGIYWTQWWFTGIPGLSGGLLAFLDSVVVLLDSVVRKHPFVQKNTRLCKNAFLTPPFAPIRGF